MLNKEQIEVFTGKFVAVGVPHLIDPEKLFFYYGILHSVTEEILTLRTINGYKIVQIEKVMDIHTSNWEKLKNDR